MRSIFQLAVTIFSFLMILGMLICVYLISLPGELPEVSGMADIRAGKIKKVHLGDRLQLAANSKTKITFTEEQLNHYLSGKVKLSQTGKVNKNLSIKGIWVELSEDTLTLYLERKAQWGGGPDESGVVQEPSEQDHITSFRFHIKTTIDADGAINRSYGSAGGTIGGAPAPGAFSLIPQAAFKELGTIFASEITYFEKMVQVHVKQDSITLHPTRD